MDFNKIITELCWRLENGTPDFSNPEHLQELKVVLIMHKWTTPAINELMETLTEATYVNNSQNRGLGRVGKEWGSSPGDASKKSKEEPEDGEVEKEPKDEPKQSPTSVVDGRDKTMYAVSPEEFSKVYDKEPTRSDKEYEAATKDYEGKDISMSTPPEAFKMPDLGESKFPKKYLVALERMMNTKLAKHVSSTGDEPTWNHFSSDKGGAGRMASQAGELISMAGTSMDDETFGKFIGSMRTHMASVRESHGPFKTKKEWEKYQSGMVLQESWIDAAENNRKANLQMIEKRYPGATIVNTAWDTKKEVEALGMKDYADNKGFSTDMYVKINHEGKDTLVEISLKKDKNVNFLNSGAGVFSEWKDPLPDELNQKVYAEGQRKRLLNVSETIGVDRLNSVLTSDSPAAKELKKLLKKKKMTIEDALDVSNKDKKKIVMKALTALAETGDKEAVQLYEKHVAAKHKFTKNAIKALANDPEMQKGMLTEIRANFPLQAVATGEESMSIGKMSFDQATMKEIFGTDNLEDIKKSLVSTNDEKGNPSLAFKSEIDGTLIHLANVKVRESGGGYNGSFKFDMALHKDFAKILKKSHAKVYGEE